MVSADETLSTDTQKNSVNAEAKEDSTEELFKKETIEADDNVETEKEIEKKIEKKESSENSSSTETEEEDEDEEPDCD